MTNSVLQRFTRQTLALLFSAAILGSAVACDDSSGPNDDTYVLQTVNGGSLPYTVPADENDAVVTSGALRLRPTMSFSLSLAGRVTPGGGAETDLRFTLRGTYTVSEDGNTLTFTVTDSNNPEIELSTFTGVRADDQITVEALEDLVFVFER